ncbi:MAG: YbaK/EbsC family protein [Candidatus Berkelbacteria bacterium]|nr:YbaK/EbsC family protein [Candidatus Berkelbacteria bacterium]
MKNKLIAILTDRNLPFEVIDHEAVITTDDVFRVLGIEYVQMVKAIILKDKRSGNLLLAVLPGDKRISRSKAAKAFGLSRSQVDLATTQEVQDRLNVEIGAIPPFGLQLVTAFDSSIDSETVYCGLGQRTSSLKIKFSDLLLVADPIISDLSA